MRRIDRWLAMIVTVASAFGAAACDTGGPARSGGTEGAPYLLQARTTQAIPPENRFDWLPGVTITTDRVVVTAGPVPASFPGPLIANLRGRTITEAGYARIVAEAESSGLLGAADGGQPPRPGAAMAEVDLWIDGAMHTIRGDPAIAVQCVRAPCPAQPGSPEAFGSFWTGIHDLAAVMPEELGPEEAYPAQAFALLVGVAPLDDMDLGIQVLDWPLDVPLADLGRPIGDEPFPRCAGVDGGDATVLGPLLESANQLTQWADGDAAPMALRARPILSGEDPCRDLFGVEG